MRQLLSRVIPLYLFICLFSKIRMHKWALWVSSLLWWVSPHIGLIITTWFSLILTVIFRLSIIKCSRNIIAKKESNNQKCYCAFLFLGAMSVSWFSQKNRGKPQPCTSLECLCSCSRPKSAWSHSQAFFCWIERVGAVACTRDLCHLVHNLSDCPSFHIILVSSNKHTISEFLEEAGIEWW